MKRTLDTCFRDTARRHPEAPALEVGRHVLTYGELDALAGRLAARLTGVDGGRPPAVGLLAARSLAAYAGYLAALRAGASVVPLNPKFPPARNARMCRAGGVTAIVVDDAGAAQADEVADLTGTHLIRLADDSDWPAELPAHPTAVGAEPDDIAYTLFTSGSTGDPKGVPIRHRNVVPYLDHCVRRYEVAPGSRLSQTFDLTFDPSVFDMFVTWTGGGTLVVPQPDEILTPVNFVRGRRITHWFSVPSVVSLARRLRALRPGSLPGLRYSLFAGEQLTLDQARAWAEAAPNSVLENIYGPTELTITCTGYRLPADPADWPHTPNGTVPIGRPYDHLDALVLPEDGAEDGGDDAEGELCLRGSQRFDGYVDPSHDRGRFVRYETGRAVEVVGRPGPRDWYRTGDRVRYQDGELVHLGRLDDQIKIHGYRVELGEIEAVLRRHPDVQDVVVLAAGAELHALYTGRPGLDRTLARTARGQLPSYMVPQHIRHVPAFPTNVNGKIDRRMLSDLATTGPDPVTATAASGR